MPQPPKPPPKFLKNGGIDGRSLKPRRSPYTEVMTMRVRPEATDLIKLKAHAAGVTIGEFVEQAVRAFDPPKRPVTGRSRARGTDPQAPS